MSPTRATKPAKVSSVIFLVAGNDEMIVKIRAKEMAAELAPAEGGEFALEMIEALDH